MSINRGLKTTFLALTLAAVMAIHLNFLPVRVQAAGHGLVNAFGTGQRWNLFSADPRNVSVYVFAEMETPREAAWTIDTDRFGGDFAYYHWARWMETVYWDRSHAALPGFVTWLEESEGALEVRVYLHTRLTPRPGQPFPAANQVQVGGRDSP